jgi:hypothetical protein
VLHETGRLELRAVLPAGVHDVLPVKAMRNSAKVSAFVLCVVAVLAPRPAHGYCRTTTAPIPNGYDPTVNGCITQGTPLAWHQSPVPVGVIQAASSQISLQDATHTEDLAIAAWNQVTCVGGKPSIQLYDDGPIAQVPQPCMSSDSCDPASQDYVVFDDSGWPHDDPANALGLTTVTFGEDDGRIFSAYTEINTATKTIVVQEPPPQGTYDLQGILTHETGHFVGLAHATATTSIMYAYYKPGAIELTSDDEQGLCAIYPPNSDSGGGDPGGCAVRPHRSGGGAPGAIATALVALAMLRRTRSGRDRERRTRRLS